MLLSAVDVDDATTLDAMFGEELMNDDRWFASWIDELDIDSLRCVIDGLCTYYADNSTKTIVVPPNVAWRDELMIVLLHAGYAPTFARTDLGNWLVSFTDDERLVEPSMHHSASNESNRFSVGRTWCFDMRSCEFVNDGFVVVRRAQRNIHFRIYCFFVI